MENLLKQLRVTFSGLKESQDDASISREGRLPPQKTVSFKGERKKAKPWFWQQFSGQLGDDDDPADLEFGAAVAAAALAILLAEEEEDKVFTNRTKPVEELQRSLTRTRSRREESISKSTDGSKISRWISGEDGKEDGRLAVSGDSFKRKPSTLDERMREKSAADLKIQEKAMDSTTGTKRTPSFSNKYLNERRSKHSDYGGDNNTAQGVPPSMNGRRIEKNKADAWEQETMEKIRKRYEKMYNTILQWENEKKVKAKRRKERKEVSYVQSIVFGLHRSK
ncbi:hypothetical protein AXF42_Ash015931 [Apostasia shenzhenica]|uniref:Remorin C-terminal domain-containing protein n=1 Tax=Apostasia shenzhenica TaxID=1088818 RepID=A0A2I0AWE4_9ASPA|nr:hypothetical protein AXF42_Ash015931 [Apostasia shenzhenica]